MDFGSPPRWRAWVTGEPSSPRGQGAGDWSPRYEMPQTYVQQHPQHGDANDHALAVMRYGIEQYEHVKATTDPSTWAWSKPLWAALFQTADALRDPVSHYASEQIFSTFYSLSSSLPCSLCAQHFAESMQTFPRSNMSRQTLSAWVSQLKREVDYRAQQRKEAAAAGQQYVTQPQYVSQPQYVAQPQQVVMQPQPQQVVVQQPQVYQTYSSVQRAYPTVSTVVYEHPAGTSPYSNSPAGSPYPPSPRAQVAASPRRDLYVERDGIYAAATSGHRTAWAEVKAHNHSNGLCTHGAINHYCDLCTNGTGSPVRVAGYSFHN